jgi:S1-C subfamily serine protease
MSDIQSSGASWVCPACDRRVPPKLAECRCGYVRGATAGQPGPESPTVRASVLGTTLFVFVGLGAVVIGAWFMNRPVVPKAASSSAAAEPARVVPTTVAATTKPPVPVAAAAPPPAAPVAVPAPVSSPVRPVESVGTPAAAGDSGVPIEEVVTRVMPAVVMIEAGNSRGSGFFVAPDTLLTNVHVVTGNVSVTIRRSDGTTTTARVERTANEFDIAVLKVTNPTPGQVTIPMGSGLNARVGQEVLAIGSPLGFLQNTVTRGIVSALRQTGTVTLVQTDAPINPGNSGGPLLSRSGIVIGITQSGYRNQDGLSFAVAIDHARALLDGRPVQSSPVAAANSSYRMLAPAIASPTDQRRQNAEHAYEQSLSQLSRAADNLDDYWRQFKGDCYQGRIVGSFDREWFAIWDSRAMQGKLAYGCSGAFDTAKNRADWIRSEVLKAEEAARQADVFPGTRRDTRRKYRLDYSGWDR